MCLNNLSIGKIIIVINHEVFSKLVFSRLHSKISKGSQFIQNILTKFCSAKISDSRTMSSSLRNTSLLKDEKFSVKTSGCNHDLQNAQELCRNKSTRKEPYRRLQLLSVCVYNARSQHTTNMRLTKRCAYTDVHACPLLTT